MKTKQQKFHWIENGWELDENGKWKWYRTTSILYNIKPYKKQKENENNKSNNKGSMANNIQ